MKKLILAFSIFLRSLQANLATTENIPSSIVGGCVSAITGQPYLIEDDLSIFSAEPIPFIRGYGAYLQPYVTTTPPKPSVWNDICDFFWMIAPLIPAIGIGVAFQPKWEFGITVGPLGGQPGPAHQDRNTYPKFTSTFEWSFRATI